MPTQRAELTLMSASFFSGPLPPPADLERYEKIYPGMTERLVALHERTFELARNQAEHRQKLEIEVIQGNLGSQSRGQWMAFIIVIASLLAGAFLIYSGKKAEGLWAMFAPLSGVLAVFVVTRSKHDKELERHRREIEAQARSQGQR